MKIAAIREIGRKSIHYSIDDTNNLFCHLTNDRYSSAFDEPILALFKRLHEDYGCVVSCFCFMEFGGFSLTKATDRFRSEFEENSGWLKFGFHGATPETCFDSLPTEQAVKEYFDGINELRRIVGADSLDYVPRFHNWLIPQPALQTIAMRGGVLGILSSEEKLPRGYTGGMLHKMRRDGYARAPGSGVWMINTDLCLERIPDGDERWLEDFLTGIRKKKHIEIFTHEWILRGADAKSVIAHFEQIARWAASENRKNAFFQETGKRTVCRIK